MDADAEARRGAGTRMTMLMLGWVNCPFLSVLELEVMIIMMGVMLG